MQNYFRQITCKNQKSVYQLAKTTTTKSCYQTIILRKQTKTTNKHSYKHSRASLSNVATPTRDTRCSRDANQQQTLTSGACVCVFVFPFAPTLPYLKRTRSKLISHTYTLFPANSSAYFDASLNFFIDFRQSCLITSLYRHVLFARDIFFYLKKSSTSFAKLYILVQELYQIQFHCTNHVS